MNTQQLQYVLTLAEEKSFSAAAERLYVTQPSLSQYIHKIENQLGAVLFDRTTKPLTLTESGEVYLHAAKQILTIENDMIQRINEIEHLETGHLQIGASTYRTSYLLPKSIAAFREKYPGIHISIHEGEQEELFEELRTGKINLIIGSAGLLPLEFDVEVLSTERLYLGIPSNFSVNEKLKKYRLTFDDLYQKNEKFLFAEPIDPCFLLEQPFILTEKGEFGREHMEKLFCSLEIDQEKMISVQTVDAAFAYTLAGVGISIIPDSLILFGNFKEHPYYYSLPEEIASVKICMFTRKQSELPNIIKNYGQFLKDLISVGTWRS